MGGRKDKNMPFVVQIILGKVLPMIGGLAMFLYGMDIMGKGLEKSAGNRLKIILARATKNTFSGFLLGLAVTLVIQSSSATTVMVVGFVNSGVMSLKQSIGVIIGANVGTSVTAWILATQTISGEGALWWLNFLKPDTFTPILAFIGIALLLFSKKPKLKNIAPILLGFAVLMFGMDVMSDSVSSLKNSDALKNIFLLFDNPVLGVIVGTVLTAIIQSSSASVGILQALSTTGMVTFASAIPIVVGQNIGTCVTALISSAGTSKNARRAACIHLLFNVIASVLLLPIFYIVNYFVGFAFMAKATNPLTIAVIHTVFKLFAVVLLMPASNLLEKLAHKLIRDGKKSDELNLPDERLFTTPAVAVGACSNSINIMGALSNNLVSRSCALIERFDEAEADLISKGEDDVDRYEDALGSYLVKLSGLDLTVEDAAETSTMLHVIGDFERISDHAKAISESCRELYEKKLAFSEAAVKELTVLKSAVSEASEFAFKAYETGDVAMASLVEPVEQVVDKLKGEIRNRHIERLKNGECTIELGFVLADLLTNLGRIADHASNIAVSVIDIKNRSFDSHAYLHGVKQDDKKFVELYKQYEKKYSI